MRFRLLVVVGSAALALAAIGSALAHVLGGSSPAATAGTLYVAPTGADGNPCTKAKPCATLQGAFEGARGGATVVVAGGNYPDQTLAGTKGAPNVVFEAAPNSRVYINDIFVRAQHVELRNLHTSYWASY